MPDCDDLPASVIVPPGCRPVRVQAFGQPPVDRPGEVVVDWERSGWSQFRPVTISADLDQSFTASVENGRGVLTGDLDHTGGSSPNRGSLRMAYLLDGTRWRNSEVTSLVWGPVGWDGVNAQQGHLHRVREITPGVWEGIMVWTSVVFGLDYRYLHYSAVRWNGTSIPQSGSTTGDDGGATDLPYVDRQVRVIGRQRVLDNVAILTFTPPGYLRYLAEDDLVDLSGISGFTDEDDVAVTTVDDRGRLQCPTTETGDVAFAAVNAGAITPASDQKRYVPFWQSTLVAGGDASELVVHAKRWRAEESEPAWSDPRVRRVTLSPNGNVPEIASQPGSCGLFGGHFYGGSQGQWGQVRARSL